jgi:hypothetical protein
MNQAPRVRGSVADHPDGTFVHEPTHLVLWERLVADSGSIERQDGEAGA